MKIRPRGGCRLLVAWTLARSVSCLEHASHEASAGEIDSSQSSLTEADTTWEHTLTTLDMVAASQQRSNTTIPTTSSKSISTRLVTRRTSSSTISTTTGISTTTDISPTTLFLSTLSPFPPDDCTTLAATATYTAIIISYTSTITFTGDPADYTPPHEPISLPTYCEDAQLPSGKTSVFESYESAPVSQYPPPSVPFISPRPTVSFITTDKNPSVIFEPASPPAYSLTRTWPGGNDQGPEGVTKVRPSSSQQAPLSIFTITTDRSQVVIGSSTIVGLLPDRTTTVTVDSSTFTILPTAIVGGHATLTRPLHVEPPSVIFPKPTSVTVGGVVVAISGSVIVADGTITLTVLSEGLTTVIGGETVSAVSGHVVVGDETLIMPTEAAQSTNLVVVGGDLLTVPGSTIVVLRSTTITYGPGIDLTTLVADDDTITVNPSGVYIHGSTLGGPDADWDDTAYQVVGGVTITEIGTAAVVVGGQTYTLGPSASTITTVAAGKTLTIGPEGVTIGNSSVVLRGAGDPTVVTTIIEPTGAWLDDIPSQTRSHTRNGEDVYGNRNDDDNDNNDIDDDEDGAFMLMIPRGFTLLFAAIGVHALAGEYM